VTKLNPSGSGLSYSTYLGGGGGEITASISRAAISVYSDGSAFVSGHTASSDFPTTSDALDRTYNGNGDAFLTRLNAAGMTAFMDLPSRSRSEAGGRPRDQPVTRRRSSKRSKSVSNE